MTENGTGRVVADTAASADAPQLRLIAQFIKDLSFERPELTAEARQSKDNPNFGINVNVDARKVQDQAYEVHLKVDAEAKIMDATLFNLELVYAGVFRLINFPDRAIQPVLLVDCPAILFPYVRRLVSDLTQEGGFPPIFLDPIDFGSLYRRELESRKAATA